MSFSFDEYGYLATGNPVENTSGTHQPIHTPDIADHFHTNQPLNERDAQFFSETLRYSLSREPYLQNEIRLLELTLIQHTQELSRVRDIIRDCKVVLSPARLVPRELWQQIFEYVRESEESIDVLDFDRGVWPLTQVCRLWRTIVLADSTYWTTVSLPLRIRYPVYSVQILSLFLERSEDKPLFIDFTCRDLETLPQTLFRVLIAHSHRWETCRLRVPVQLLKHLTPCAIKRAKLLWHFDANLDMVYSSSLSTSCNDIFADAPALRSVKLTGVPLTPATLGFRWSSLTVYDVAQDTPEKHLGILPLATELVECTIRCTQPWRFNMPPVQALYTATLQKLTTLRLEGTSYLLLKYIIAPNLFSLNTVLPERDDSLKVFLERSEPPLEELSIEAIPMGSNILDILQSTTQVRKLALLVSIPRQSSVFKDLLKALKYIRGGLLSTAPARYNLPRLEELVLSVYIQSSHDDNLFANELMEMVTSRWKVTGKGRQGLKQTPAQLKSFTLETNSYWLPAFDAFGVMNQEGLDTKICLH
ncbi:hypothetical protein EV360DRAFT_80791 [Lentinula raphanica]|nr:hypothetical protein EV360DRAFT_80791 [Lentinula raphanica]